jgi:DNA-binding NarL/FixJ family response regulator
MSEGATVKVLLADDQQVVRAGLAMLLDSQPSLRVLGQAGDGLEAVRLARELKPDVVLMDIRMPVLDGIEATRRILSDAAGRATGEQADRGERPVRVVVLTTYDLDEYVYDALRAGRLRVPAQTRSAGGAAARRPGSGRRRRAALPIGD